MGYEVGERIKYQDEWNFGQFVVGKIIGITRNRLNIVTAYLVQLDSGKYAQVSPYKVSRG